MIRVGCSRSYGVGYSINLDWQCEGALILLNLIDLDRFFYIVPYQYRMGNIGSITIRLNRKDRR